MPDVDRLVVVEVHRDPKFRFLEPVASIGYRPSQQFPRERNRLLLEVIPEGEVARHLEERRVTGRLADLVDIEGAHDFLHTRGAWIRRRGLTEEIRLEGHHPRVDEEKRRIV